MILFLVDDEEVDKIVAVLNPNKSTGLDGISLKILKSMVPVILPHLTRLIISSFSRAIFPGCLKKGSVTPLFKKGSISEVRNYRPVSILPVVSKVFKRAMYIRLHGFMNKRFNKKQFVFRSRCSTVLAIAEIVEKVQFKMLTKQFCIFFDFSKAFFTVNNDLMIETGKL